MQTVNKIPVSQPSITELEKKYVNDALERNWISSAGDYITKFEEAWSNYNGYKYGVACSSGYTALVLALKALGIKEGDEVIVPEFTMIATAWAVTLCGGRPVFVDCDQKMLINPEKIEAAITPRTKAIIPVHIYGRQCDMEKIMKIAHDYNLYVVEDSAEAHGIKPVGDIACFSLYGNKIITSGEGGVCLANDPRLAEQMKHLRGCAFDPQHSFLHKKMAYNFRMTNMQAAVAFAQVERIDEILAKRREVEKWYDEGLADIKQEPGKLGVETLPRDVVWFYDIMVLPRLRDELMAYLKERGIETRLFFKPMSQQPQYLDPDYPDRYLTVSAYRFSLAGLYLPTFTDMTKEQVAFVCKTIKEFFVWMQEKESTSQS